MGGGLHRYAAQASLKVDAARAEKHHFWTEIRLSWSLGHGEGLGGHEQSAAVPPVGEDSGEGRNPKGGNLAAEADRPQEKLRASHQVDEPAHGDLLHPGADERYALPEEEPVVSVGERAKESPACLPYLVRELFLSRFHPAGLFDLLLLCPCPC